MTGVLFICKSLNEPVYYFRADDGPSALPPQTRQTYLSVPVGIAEGLNAKAAHQQGVKGDGVKVVMVDTGWYRHPFFSQNNYQGRVVLGPGSTHPERDDDGHGTGESANLFAVAPHVELTVVKADVAIDGKLRNVNSIAAFKRAVDLCPDIISCSWGSDQRTRQLSPYNQALAAVVADAVRRGIIVIFSAGNGHRGFPAQHPDVIAAGGVYRHLEGARKGQLKASSYASGFISPVYPGRVVPDVCGLVGQPPRAAYILLPVPPGSSTDWGCSLGGDGTEPADGWAAFSGTSAAAPQIAGICALMKQLDPGLSPAQVREILRQTAIDVTSGSSNSQAGGYPRGYPAIPGLDLATGYGLADAYAAVQAVQTRREESFCDNRASPVQNFSRANPIVKRRQSIMYSQFPKLKSKLNQLLWKFEQELQAATEKWGLEDVELAISEDNFIARSPLTKAAYSFRAILYGDTHISGNNSGCIDENGEVDTSKIEEIHISAALALLKLGRDQEAALNVLTQALLMPGTNPEAKKIKKLAMEALSECGSEIASLDTRREDEVTSLYKDGSTCYVNGVQGTWSDKYNKCITPYFLPGH